MSSKFQVEARVRLRDDYFHIPAGSEGRVVGHRFPYTVVDWDNPGPYGYLHSERELEAIDE